MQLDEDHGMKPLTPENVGKLLQQIFDLNRDKKLVQSRLSDYVREEQDIPKFSRSRLNEMLRDRQLYADDKKQMDPKLYKALNHYLLDIHHEVQNDDRAAIYEYDQHMFYSLLKSCSVGPINEEDAKRRLPGTYIMYRPSVVIPGQVLITFCRIDHDKITNVVSFTEISRERAANEGHHDDNGYRWTGYILNTPTKYFGYQIDQGNGFPRTTIFDEHYYEKGKVTQLVGVTMGTLGNANYVSPVYMHRWKDDELTFKKMLAVKFKDNKGKTAEDRYLLDMHDENHIDQIAYQLLKNRLGNTMVLWDRGSLGQQ